MEQRKIIMDCDPGIDDAMALAYAASRPDAFKILAVTTVAGNQELQKVTANALDLTAFYGLDTEVAAGMSQPLINKLAPATDYHGENGLGNCVLPGSEKQAVEEMAVFYIRRKLMELPENEKATLVCTAPLTNIAMLLKLFPEVKSRICEIIFMGGSASGGNVTASAEFNIYEDPESARIVFRSGIPVVMCGLDATEKCALTASQVFHVPFDEVTDLQRRNAKAVNFGIVYGISSFGLSQDLSISRKEAAQYIEHYFESYPGIKTFLDKCVSDAKEKGYAETLYGRRRPMPELKSSNFMQRSFGERVAMNAPIQGTAADIIKIAMIHVNEELKKRNLKSRMILQVHDELLIETDETELEEVQQILQDKMEHAAELLVPLSVDMHTGKNWYEAK